MEIYRNNPQCLNQLFHRLKINTLDHVVHLLPHAMQFCFQYIRQFKILFNKITSPPPLFVPFVVVAEFKVSVLSFHFLKIVHVPILCHITSNVGDDVTFDEIHLRLSVIHTITEFLSDSFDKIFLPHFKFLIICTQSEFSSKIITHQPYNIGLTAL